MILTVCQFGHSRSLAMARILHKHKKCAIACGWATAGVTWINYLCEKAEKIVVMDLDYTKYIPAQYANKIVVTHVGPDRWSNPYNQELLALCEVLAKNNKLI